ncbi:TIGR03619 family F420-dependent LLM class oxidoreductase [Pseudonocardia cypriaca]|uniref:Putative F420-dependent oxidoreductase n=1 Tax=Pseudonocardia cypriaca TaxID=882449 RepID=A0A543FQD2_9PSEU|nr:TIGR03619 family F420-dependent LLM class oxidoreductase [Pseudonocardia cypriaca]TQM36043.1 putative F420-dependent oxidoreductase [Pseudonocardia cypriaca]
MRLGIALPTTGDSAGAETITEVASTAERTGLHSLWTFERLLSPTAGGQMNGQTVPLPDAYDSVLAPLEVLAFAAAHTSRITLGTSVVVALLHNPADLARRFATLDRLSGGRVVAGLAQGWMAQEFEAAGVPLSNRGPRFSEFIEAVRALWGPDPVSYDGRFYRIEESNVGPKPTRAGGIPILAGAGSPAGIRRAARLGLGLNPVWFGWEALEGAVQVFRAAAAEAGHDPETLPVVVRVNQFPAAEPTADGASPTGSPEQILEAIPRLEAIGVTELLWNLDDDGPLDDQLSRLAQLAGASV